MNKVEKDLRLKLAVAEGELRANARAHHSRRCTCRFCWSERRRCGHAECLMAAIDAGEGSPVICQKKD